MLLVVLVALEEQLPKTHLPGPQEQSYLAVLVQEEVAAVDHYLPYIRAELLEETMALLAGADMPELMVVLEFKV